MRRNMIRGEAEIDYNKLSPKIVFYEVGVCCFWSVGLLEQWIGVAISHGS